MRLAFLSLIFALVLPVSLARQSSANDFCAKNEASDSQAQAHCAVLLGILAKAGDADARSMLGELAGQGGNDAASGDSSGLNQRYNQLKGLGNLSAEDDNILPGLETQGEAPEPSSPDYAKNVASALLEAARCNQ